MRKRFVFVFMGLLFVSGCASINPLCAIPLPHRWTEEVYLPDGKIVDVEMSTLMRTVGGEIAHGASCWGAPGKYKLTYKDMAFPWRGNYPVAFGIEKAKNKTETYIVTTRVSCSTPGIGSEGPKTPFVTFRGSEENIPREVYSSGTARDVERAYWVRIDTYSQEAVKRRNLSWNQKIYGYTSLAEKQGMQYSMAETPEISKETAKKMCYYE